MVFVRKKPRHPVAPAPSRRDPDLNLNVIVTSPASTRAALKAAGELARGLGARVTILLAQVVPYPLPLERPPVPAEFAENALRQMLGEPDLESILQVYLCRDRSETIRGALGPDSVVVMGARRRWWPTLEQRLARMLQRDGHHVILVNSDTFEAPRVTAIQPAQ